MAIMIGWGGLRPLPCEQGSGPECESQKRGLSGLLVSALTSYLVDLVTGYLVDALTSRPVPWSDVQSSKLMEVELPLVGEQTCRDAYPDATIDHRTLCAGMRRGRKYSCQGDSGGPLVVRDDDTWVQAGVVSWGVSCANPGRFGVYTRVGAFADWIRAETGLGTEVAGSGAASQEVTWVGARGIDTGRDVTGGAVIAGARDDRRAAGRSVARDIVIRRFLKQCTPVGMWPRQPAKRSVRTTPLESASRSGPRHGSGSAIR